jgi:hypothetical protein
MNIVNRRNAVIGYLALQALKRARRNATVGYLAAQGMEHTRARRRNRRALKVSLYVLLGIVSLGVLAAAAGFAGKRKSRATAAPPEAAPTDQSAEAPAESAPAEAEPVTAT